jgi:hypothetical protein
MIYTLKIECITGPYLREQCIRVIEIDESESLYDLHLVVQEAVEFRDDHLYMFYAGRNWRHKKIWMTEKEEWEDKEDDFMKTELRDIYPLKNMKLYYWFNFRDKWIFEIRKSRKIKEEEPGVQYPRVIESIGPNPPQYPKNRESFLEIIREGLEKKVRDAERS